MKVFMIALVLATLAFTGCEKKVEPVQVGEMNEYRDPAFGFKIRYPKDWMQLGTTGKALFCRSQEVAGKFIDPATGEEGAEVSAEIMQYGGKSFDDIVRASKEDLRQNAQLKPDEQITAGGKQSVKVSYSLKVTSKASIDGFEIYVPGDTAVYKLDFAGYGAQFAAHAAVFDAMLKSFELPVIIAKKSDTWQASPNLESAANAFFTIQYPDNLNFAPVSKGDKDLVIELRADRQDCSIHLDVFGAKGLSVEKVWDQNKARYKAKAKGQSTIDGHPAYWVDYSNMANISSRAYFVVKNDKAIRATLNWFAPQKDAYFPAFEKIVGTMKLK